MYLLHKYVPVVIARCMQKRRQRNENSCGREVSKHSILMGLVSVINASQESLRLPPKVQLIDPKGMGERDSTQYVPDTTVHVLWQEAGGGEGVGRAQDKPGRDKDA